MRTLDYSLTPFCIPVHPNASGFAYSDGLLQSTPCSETTLFTSTPFLNTNIRSHRYLMMNVAFTRPVKEAGSLK